MRIAKSLLFVIFVCAAAHADDVIGPYLQQPTQNSIIVCWRTQQPEIGVVEVTGESGRITNTADETPVQAHALKITGLQPGTKYSYRVGNHTALGKSFYFSTAPSRDSAIRFAMFGDPQLSVVTHSQPFSLFQQVVDKHPNILLIAGDLTDMGGSKDDWNLFWETFTSGRSYYLAQDIPIASALGNHDYWGGLIDGYSPQKSERAVARFKSFFHPPPNGARNPEYQGRYYSMTYGPVTFIVLDSNNDDAGPEFDTNKMLTGGNAPGLNPESEQYRWLEQELAKAKRESQFTFLMFHHAPFSAGTHGNPDDKLSGYPLRRLDPLFHKYHVTAVLSGHDHINQRVHTIGSDGREVIYITATANAPRDVQPQSDTWLDSDQRIKRLFFNNSERCFLLGTISLENGEWHTKLEFVGQSGRIHDATEVMRNTNGTANLVETRLAAGPIAECGAFVALTIGAWLVFRPRERNDR